MSLTVVGSIAFDSVRTPFGERERMLGGSAVHFSLAASFFTEVRVVGPVGEDFGAEEMEVLESRGVDTTDVERVDGGRTFFWRAHYDFDLNTAHTEDTQLTSSASSRPSSQRIRGRRRPSSSPTSNRTCSGRCGPSAQRRGSRRWTR